jgi:hypothetical protein
MKVIRHIKRANACQGTVGKALATTAHAAEQRVFNSKSLQGGR